MSNHKTLDQHIDDLYGDANYQSLILESENRDSIITWLIWNDPNGVYTDEDSDLEDMPRLTLESAKAIMARQIEQ